MSTPRATNTSTGAPGTDGGQNRPALTDVATALRGALPDLDADGRNLAVTMYRLLARGAPVGEAEAARGAGLPEDRVREMLGSWPGVNRDDAGAVVGFWGLTMVEMPPHRYTVDGVDLWTWCAWDTLFITPILGRESTVESRDPHGGDVITLTVGPDGPRTASHPDAVVSFLFPRGKFDADVVTTFCHFVHFFTDRRSGQAWAAEHPGTFLLTLPEAFGLGLDYTEAVLGSSRRV